MVGVGHLRATLDSTAMVHVQRPEMSSSPRSVAWRTVSGAEQREPDRKPGSIDGRVGGQILLELIQAHPGPVVDLLAIWLRIAVGLSDDEMYKLVFREGAPTVGGLVDER